MPTYLSYKTSKEALSDIFKRAINDLSSFILKQRYKDFSNALSIDVISRCNPVKRKFLVHHVVAVGVQAVALFVIESDIPVLEMDHCRVSRRLLCNSVWSTPVGSHLFRVLTTFHFFIIYAHGRSLWLPERLFPQQARTRLPKCPELQSGRGFLPQEASAAPDCMQIAIVLTGLPPALS